MSKPPRIDDMKVCAGGCGRRVAGVRCRSCFAKLEQTRAALDNDRSDRELLRKLSEGLSQAEIARRERVTKVAVGLRVRKARERQALLRELTGAA